MLAAVMATVPKTTCAAGAWEKVVSDSKHTVEIDSSTIFDAEHGAKVSWGRIVLNASEAKQAGYRTVKALNRYDCLGRSFTTVKRIYIDNDNHILREEAIPEQRPVTVRNNSIDEQVWRRVCGLAATSAGSKPGNYGKAAPNAMNRVSKLADVANQAAWNTLQTIEPSRVVQNTSSPLPEKSSVFQQGNPDGSVKEKPVPLPPKAMLLPPASANEGAVPKSDPAAPTATDSLPTSIPPTPAPLPAAIAPVLPIQIKPITMPSVPQNPATPIAPKRPESPTVPQSQKRLPNVPPPLRRGSVTQPLVLPAPTPTVSARDRANNSAPAQQSVFFPESGEGWGYSDAIGPEFWGKLRPEWNLCAEGKRQSPIDFMSVKSVAVGLDPVKFDYRPANFVIINGSQQLRVRVTESMGMEVRGQRYVLEGFTLHRPAETRIDNKAADMEAHFFHRDGNGRVAVLAVQFVRGGQPSAPLQTLLNNLPLERGDSYVPLTTLDMAAFLPPDTSHYLYMGSLTTPPCTEGVLWVVMKEPMTLSDGQYEIFSHLHADNARPPQPAFDRLILESH
ncbi:MAG: carbonic anhydrase family protein [Betaproteobacteria bacterium]|nr:carbonic anhydrase family protein [Betaproteobacteria bacterium]